jgi:hypothetical protein
MTNHIRDLKSFDIIEMIQNLALELVTLLLLLGFPGVKAHPGDQLPQDFFVIFLSPSRQSKERSSLRIVFSSLAVQMQIFMACGMFFLPSRQIASSFHVLRKFIISCSLFKA